MATASDYTSPNINYKQLETMKPVQIEIRRSGKKNKVITIDNGCLYIKMGKWTYYFDNSTDDEHKSRFKTN
jgi:hypothetical protein